MFLYNCQRETRRVAAAKKEIIKRDKTKMDATNKRE